MRARLMHLVLALLPPVLSAQAQAADCASPSRYAFSFSSRPTTQLGYGSAYTYTATRPAGGSVNFSVALNASDLSSTSVGGETMPRITSLVSGNTSVRHLVFGGTFSGRTSSITGTSRVIVVTFTFPNPVVSFSMTADDIDYAANQFRDWVAITGSNGSATFTPSMTTPWGNNNAGTSTASGSSIAFGPRSATPALANASQLAGTGTSDIGTSTGRFTLNFAQPVTTISLRYGNFPGESTTGQQGMGISDIAFCEMARATFAKTSEPVAGPLGAYDTPGNDVIYTLTVTNPTGTTIDAGSIVLNDILPANMIFRNAPFDTTTSLPVKLLTPGGLSLGASSLVYRQWGGTAFGYVPASGYDQQVAELRIAPSGELAANASAVFQFRAQIK